MHIYFNSTNKIKKIIFRSYSNFIKSSRDKNKIENKTNYNNNKLKLISNEINNNNIKLTKEEKKQIVDLYTSTLPNIQELEIYTGTITQITKRIILVDIGFKSEGSIQLSEFKDDNDVSIKIGNNIEVMLLKIDYKGKCILSYKQAKILKSWKKINDVYKKSEIVLGYVASRTKGGLIVEVFDIECFLPGSHINVKPVRDYDIYVGKTIEVKVVKINQKTKNVVVSHKILIERDIEDQKKEMISKLNKGQVLTGKIKNILPYGAFVDLGGVDALLHITDMSWPHINHPTEIVQLDQELKFVVLGVDKCKNRVQLGLKQLQQHPWDSLNEKIKVGNKVKGKVSVLTDYGAFVEIIPGVEALLHISEMSWNTDLSSPQDFVQVGDELNAIILTIDKKDRKMSLSTKQLTHDPWIDAINKYKIGSKHIGKVKKFTHFGLIIELDKCISGIIYTNDLSWIKKIKHPSEFCSINDKLNVIVISLDIQSRRIHLGHKQLHENPWNNYEKNYSIGTIHSGILVKSFDKGATIQFKNNPELETFTPFRFLEKKNGNFLKNGEMADFKVIEFNKELKKIVISHTAIHKKDYIHKKDKKKIRNRKFEKSTLGDLEGLAKLKEKIEKEKNK